MKLSIETSLQPVNGDMGSQPCQVPIENQLIEHLYDKDKKKGKEEAEKEKEK